MLVLVDVDAVIPVVALFVFTVSAFPLSLEPIWTPLPLVCTVGIEWLWPLSLIVVEELELALWLCAGIWLVASVTELAPPVAFTA